MKHMIEQEQRKRERRREEGEKDDENEHACINAIKSHEFLVSATFDNTECFRREHNDLVCCSNGGQSEIEKESMLKSTPEQSSNTQNVTATKTRDNEAKEQRTRKDDAKWRNPIESPVCDHNACCGAR